MEEKHIHFKQENVYGDKYDIHDNPNATFNFGGRREEAHREQRDSREDALVEELTPIFYNDVEEVRRYAQAISGCKPTQVVDITGKLLHERKISDRACHKELWEILTRHGLYDKTLANWNSQLKNYL